MEKAIKILNAGDYTCVFHKDGKIITSDKRGVAPLLKLLDDKTSVSGFCAADKVVGKGAAFLYVLLGVKSVYAKVVSKPALEVLEKNNIETRYDTLCDFIINRAGTGRCPIETATMEIDSASVALIAIRSTLESLK